MFFITGLGGGHLRLDIVRYSLHFSGKFLSIPASWAVRNRNRFKAYIGVKPVVGKEWGCLDSFRIGSI